MLRRKLVMNFINEKKNTRKIQLKLNLLIFELIFFLRKPVDHETAIWACCKTAAVSQCPQLSISEGTNTKLHDVLKEKPIDLLI